MFDAIKRALSKYNKKKNLEKIRLGICAMDKKAKSKPMREILTRLPEEIFEIVIFGDECILNQPIESWPVIDCLIAFFSKGFPTAKALEYVKLRQPFMINDLEMDAVLKDRRRVYQILESEGIDIPFHVLCERDDPNAVNVIEEFDEYIVVNGVQVSKPLVEKPVDAEDHNIYIYYPMSAGGGSKRLFRKVDDRSSEFYPHVNEVRREGSYIYERFVITQGTDVKVYTVGQDYGHAEARKSPVVDGKVNRDEKGLEVRFPVILSPIEKDMARKIVRAFKQTVCGFDILRVQEKSYCCDVNGFSFVKNSRKYYDDASQVLVEIMISAIRPDLHLQLSTRAPLVRPRPQTRKTPEPGGGAGNYTVARSSTRTISASNSRNNVRVNNDDDETSSQSGNSNGNNGGGGAAGNIVAGFRNMMRRGSVADVAEATGLPTLFRSVSGSPSPSLEVTAAGGAGVALVPSHQSMNDNMSESGTTYRDNDSHSLFSLDHEKEELRCVIGIIRHGDRTPKQKMKLPISEQRFLDYFHHYSGSPKKDLKVKSKSALVRFLEVTREVIADPETSVNSKILLRKLKQIRDVLERWEISGINRKLQMKPEKWAEVDVVKTAPMIGVRGPIDATNNSNSINDDVSQMIIPNTVIVKELRATSVLVILKWGGDLTPLGRKQAEELGENFRYMMYPDTGGGMLRLHATYRHDLKIKSSDEGRVMKTAAAFAKGLLELEGPLTPILASLVTVEEKSSQMLDREGNRDIKQEMDRCKEHSNLLQTDAVIDEDLVKLIAPDCTSAQKAAMLSLGNPVSTLQKMHSLIGSLCDQLNELIKSNSDENGDLNSENQPIEGSMNSSFTATEKSTLSTAQSKGKMQLRDSFNEEQAKQLLTDSVAAAAAYATAAAAAASAAATAVTVDVSSQSASKDDASGDDKKALIVGDDSSAVKLLIDPNYVTSASAGSASASGGSGSASGGVHTDEWLPSQTTSPLSVYSPHTGNEYTSSAAAPAAVFPSPTQQQNATTAAVEAAVAVAEAAAISADKVYSSAEAERYQLPHSKDSLYRPGDSVAIESEQLTADDAQTDANTGKDTKDVQAQQSSESSSVAKESKDKPVPPNDDSLYSAPRDAEKPLPHRQDSTGQIDRRSVTISTPSASDTAAVTGHTADTDPAESQLPSVTVNQVESTAPHSSSQTSSSGVSSSVASKKTSTRLYLDETLQLMADRWEKLYKDFYNTKLGKYDLSKVPDIYDAIRYEVLHNAHIKLDDMKELYELSMHFENTVVPQEYGIDRNDKRKIGAMMCHFLLEKIKNDLVISSSGDDQHVNDMRFKLDEAHADDLAINSFGRSVRTRLYFTSESHLHTLLNVLRYGGDDGGPSSAIDKLGLEKLDSISELSYLTQILIRLFEDREDPTKFRCEISFSPGAVCDPFTNKTSELAPTMLLNKTIPVEVLLAYLDSAINIGRSLEASEEHQRTVANYNMSLYGSGNSNNPSIHGTTK